ncbi:unnamed protein product [Heterobilharzia americana]|nr:unnamed protein product [Heterobilharzia americana]
MNIALQQLLRCFNTINGNLSTLPVTVLKIDTSQTSVCIFSGFVLVDLVYTWSRIYSYFTNECLSLSFPQKVRLSFQMS